MSVTISGDTGISAIPDDIVTTSKILDGDVTTAKLDATVLQDYSRRELIAPQATTAGTVITFTGIASWAKRVTIMFNGVSLSGTDNIKIRAVDGTGIVTGSYDSASMRNVTTSTYNYAVTASDCFIVLFGAVATNALTGAYTLTNFNNDNWVGSGVFTTNSTTIVTVSGFAGGLANALEGLSIATTGSNTFDSGSIALLVEG
jgi:hypothetical protein